MPIKMKTKEKKGVNISLSPVMYVQFDDETQYDKITQELTGCVSGDGHTVMSAGYFRDQLNSIKEEGEDLPEELKEVERTIDAINFNGDVWLYAR